MDKHAREQLAAHVLGYAGADQTEVLIADENAALTRFTHNAIHQNVAHADTQISVRSIVGGKTGVARTNRLDDASLHAVVRRSLDIANLAPSDPLQPALPGAAVVSAPDGAYALESAQATAAARAHACDQMFTIAEGAGYWSAGFLTTSQTGTTIVNTHGARQSFDATDAALNIKVNAVDSSGYAEQFDTNFARIDAVAAATRAAEKARTSAKPQSVDPGEWTVILEPAAFGELFTYIADHFSAQSVDQGSSFLSDGLDRTYMGENITVLEDHTHPLSPGMPFDYEGTPTKRLTLIKNGVGTAFVTDSYWAAKLDRENTGHALPAPNAWGPQARNTVVAPGTKSLETLIAETKRGLLVSRFWYIRTVDQRLTVVTGMTRDGTFLIENGKVTAGARNMRFNQSILEALRNCELSSEQVRTGSYAYSTVVPAAKIEGFRFSSGTTF